MVMWMKAKKMMMKKSEEKLNNFFPNNLLIIEVYKLFKLYFLPFQVH